MPLTVAQRAEVAAAVTVSAGRHPWPRPLPGAWTGRFGGADVDYVPVEPVLVAEVVVDRAYDRGRWRHPVRHVRLRPDLDPSRLPGWTPGGSGVAPGTGPAPGEMS